MSAAVPVPIQVLVGLAVKAHRLRLSLTQAQLAERVGISEQGLSKVERGQSSATLQTLESISVALEVPIRELFPASSDAVVKDEAAKRILAQLAGLSTDELRRVEEVIAAVLR